MKCDKTTSGICNYLHYKRAEGERADREIAEAFTLVAGEMVKHGALWPHGSPIPDGPFEGETI